MCVRVCVFDGVLFLKVLFRCSPATICRLKCVDVLGGPGKELRLDMITEVADVNGGAWEGGGREGGHWRCLMAEAHRSGMKDGDHN